MKKYGICFLYSVVSIFILTLILTILNYFNVINSNTFRLIIIIISLLTGSYILGTKSIKKGYFEGLKFGFIFLIIILLLSIFLKEKIKINNLIYYLIILSTSMTGSMLGIQKKKKD